jgi:hypothetical protein
VHGEKTKMCFLQKKITKEFGINCFYPPNGTIIAIDPDLRLPATLSAEIVLRAQEASNMNAAACGMRTACINEFSSAVKEKEEPNENSKEQNENSKEQKEKKEQEQKEQKEQATNRMLKRIIGQNDNAAFEAVVSLSDGKASERPID